jgi:hypothetical protein
MPDDEKLRSFVEHEDKRIGEAKEVMRRELTDLHHIIDMCLRAGGVYDSRIHQTAARMLEKDAEIRALEFLRVRLVVLGPAALTPPASSKPPSEGKP